MTQTTDKNVAEKPTKEVKAQYKDIYGGWTTREVLMHLLVRISVHERAILRQQETINKVLEAVQASQNLGDMKIG